MNITEVFHDIEGYEGLYEVSNLGRIRRGNKILNPPKYSTGYRVQKLSKEGVAERVLVHRLVAKAFILNPEDKPCVNHKDGNKENNSVTNLEWITLKDNIIHATKTGLRSKGSAHPTAKLKESDIPLIRELLSRKLPQRKIADFFGVRQAAIRDIKNNLTWKHV
jgi:hypothetical protein